MALILLSLLCNYDNLILTLHQKKIATLMKSVFFIGRLKVGSVLEMINKERLAEFMYKPA